MNTMQAIQELTGIKPGAPPPKTYLCCEACFYTYPMENAVIPPLCPKCSQAARQWPGETVQQATSRAKKVKSAVAPVALVAPVVPVAPAAPFKKSRVTKQPITQIKIPVATFSETTGPKDYKALRAKFAVERGLNEIEFKPVGSGVVAAIGFTVWCEVEGIRVPAYKFMESFDTPESFRGLMETYAKSSGRVAIDALRIINLDSALDEVGFNHELIATSNIGHGSIRILPGAVANILAKVSKAGGLVFGAAAK